jgi:hypothetical protein
LTNRAAAAWLAGLLLVAALIAGLAPVHANDVSCGSALGGGNDEASTAQFGENIGAAMGGRAVAVDFEADCADRRTTQQAFVIPVLLVAALGGGFLLLTVGRRNVRTERGTTASP